MTPPGTIANRCCCGQWAAMSLSASRHCRNSTSCRRRSSSTADIAATAVATAHHLGHLLDEPTLARLCVALEPTDSTLFRQLTLFDHNTAATQIACPPPPALDLLVLESPLTLRTTDYHQLPREPGLLANASRLQLAWEKVQQACHCGSPQLLGEAATISAIASQQLLPKPGFDALLDLVESAGLYGLNVAHSGSVVGLLLAIPLATGIVECRVMRICWLSAGG